MMENEINMYADIIELPHHTSTIYPRMSRQERAAQFSAFQALTSHGEAVREVARYTEDRGDPDDSCIELLNRRLLFLRDNLSMHPLVTLTYFSPDKRKNGGAFVNVTEYVKKIDEYERLIHLENGERVSFDQLFALEGDLFQMFPM